MQCKHYQILLGRTCGWSLWTGGRFTEVVFKTGSTVAETEFENSRKITSELTPLIINQSIQYNINEKKVKKLKQDTKKIKENNYKSCLQELIAQMNETEGV